MIFFIKEHLFGHLYEVEIILRHHVKLPKLIPDTMISINITGDH